MDPPKKDEEEDAFTFTGKTLDADGNVESVETTTKTHRRVRVAARMDAPAHVPEASGKPQELELEARPQRAEADYVPLPPPPSPGTSSGGRSSWPLLLVLALMIGGAWYYFFGKKQEPPARARIAVTITITSEPEGASVSVEGTPVGVTPWASDNLWQPGPVNVTVTHAGYRPWSGTFQGGRPARIEARMQRR